MMNFIKRYEIKKNYFTLFINIRKTYNNGKNKLKSYLTSKEKEQANEWPVP